MKNSALINNKLTNYLLFGFNLFLGILLLLFLLKDFNPNLRAPSSRGWSKIIMLYSQFFFWFMLLSLGMLAPIFNKIYKYSLVVLTALILNVPAYFISIPFLVGSLIFSILLIYLSFYFYRKNANIVNYLCFASILVAIVLITILAFT